MNIDRLSPLLQRTTLLLSLAAGSFLLTACGGGSDNKSSASSSSISSSSSLRSSFSSASVPANGSGIWPSVKVEAQSPKVLTFQWSAVEGATHYKLYKQDAENGAVLLADNITTTSASDEIGVHIHDWVNTRYWVDACVADDCSQRSDMTFTATEMIKAIGYFKASNTGSFDWFGWSITLSSDGMTMAIGAPAEDSKAVGINGDQTNNEIVNAGAVYVFVKEDGLWVQQAYLKASNTEQPNLNGLRVLPNDRFGYRVALSDDGNTLAVSALLEDSPSYGVNCNQDNYEQVISSAASSGGTGNLLAARTLDVGAVYIFTRSAGTWTQDAYVKPIFSTLHAFAQSAVALRFGESLALSGDGKTLAVGTSEDFISRSGVFNFNASSSMSSLACLEFYPSSSSSTSSTSSSSSSTTSSSSSAGSSYRGGSASGAIYTFRLGENGWKEESHVKASNAEQNDAFGVSIALSTDGNTMVVGAISEDSNATGVNGDQSKNSCYYFNEGAYVIDPECEEAGRYQVRGVIDNGAAYVFKRTADLWNQEAYLKPASTYMYTAFGTSVDVSGDGNTLVIGAPGDASKATTINGDVAQDIEFANTGAAYVFAKSGESWSQEAIVKPSTLTKHTGISLVAVTSVTYSIQINGGGQFGNSVSLSDDGNILAVGSFRESSYATGINGDEGDTSKADAGAVFVFTRNNTVWSQKSYVKASNPDASDRFGLNVELSGDGKNMLVGAHRESGRGYTSVAASSGASTSSAASSAGLDQSDNNLEASGAVYLY